ADSHGLSLKDMLGKPVTVRIAQQVAAKAAIQTRLADDLREARALQNAAADTRTFDRHIGVANASVSEAAHVHRDHEATLADLQRAARKAKAAEDKLDKAGEKALHARAARVEHDADEVADAHAVRRFATAGVWAGDAHAHASEQPEMAAVFDAQMVSRPADADADGTDAADTSDPTAADTAPTPAADPAPAAADRRC
ncbi:hypothetical protein, partial [Burkholderia diffusa]|uniref:hypothetical protein n=1 Tax=Burkholderia diffusa TaxID=488732 RepID=UPI001243FDA6